MQQLTLDFALPPEAVSTLAIPFTADLKRALVTHMVTAIIAVYHAGGSLRACLKSLRGLCRMEI
jgi:hypothetical protein